jgi:hypothetical protein
MKKKRLKNIIKIRADLTIAENIYAICSGGTCVNIRKRRVYWYSAIMLKGLLTTTTRLL